MVPVLKVLAALASQQEGITIAVKAVVALAENAHKEGREVSREEMAGLSLGAHTAVDSLGRALAETE